MAGGWSAHTTHTRHLVIVAQRPAQRKARGVMPSGTHDDCGRFTRPVDNYARERQTCHQCCSGFVWATVWLEPTAGKAVDNLRVSVSSSLNVKSTCVINSLASSCGSFSCGVT